MEFDNFLVKWIDEIPIRTSIMTRSDIVEDDKKTRPGNVLVGETLNFKWKKLICRGEVTGFGAKSDLQRQLLNEVRKAKPPKANSNTISGLKKRSLPVKTADLHIGKKTKLDAIVNQVEHDGLNFEKDAIIESLRKQLKIETELRAAAEGKCDEMRKAMETAVYPHQDFETNIGNGIMISRQCLSTMRTISSTINIYARNLFKSLFALHELQGHSFLGKGCNANKGLEKLPAIDAAKRDAIIEHSLTTYGIKPGTELYKFGLKDLKQSLSCLMREMISEAKQVEDNIVVL